MTVDQPLRHEQKLPLYSPREETFNLYSHLLGVLIGIAMVIFSLFFSHSAEGMACGLVFAGTLILLYLASSVYHGLPVRWPRAKEVFRVADHCSIFLLCAGSCTPFLFSAFQNRPAWQGWLINLSFWGIALVGIVLLIWDLERFKKASIGLYVLMGLILLSQGDALRQGLGEHGFQLLIAGGILYCAGLVLYSLKRPGTHGAFHVLCLIASSLHCGCVTVYII